MGPTRVHAMGLFPTKQLQTSSSSDTEPTGLSFPCMRVCVCVQPKQVFLQQSEDISGMSGHLPGPHNSPQRHLVFRVGFRVKVGFGN